MALRPLPRPQIPIVTDSAMTPEFFDYLRAIDDLLRPLSNGLVDAVDDAAAETAGVKIGQLYRNGSAVQIRIA